MYVFFEERDGGHVGFFDVFLVSITHPQLSLEEVELLAVLLLVLGVALVAPKQVAPQLFVLFVLLLVQVFDANQLLEPLVVFLALFGLSALVELGLVIFELLVFCRLAGCALGPAALRHHFFVASCEFGVEDDVGAAGGK